ncbi:MAG: hypothetical protein ABW189_05710 [Rickettsiales bacterium]
MRNIFKKLTRSCNNGLRRLFSRREENAPPTINKAHNHGGDASPKKIHEEKKTDPSRVDVTIERANPSAVGFSSSFHFSVERPLRTACASVDIASPRPVASPPKDLLADPPHETPETPIAGLPDIKEFLRSGSYVSKHPSRPPHIAKIEEEANAIILDEPKALRGEPEPFDRVFDRAAENLGVSMRWRDYVAFNNEQKKGQYLMDILKKMSAFYINYLDRHLEKNTKKEFTEEVIRNNATYGILMDEKDLKNTFYLYDTVNYHIQSGVSWNDFVDDNKTWRDKISSINTALDSARRIEDKKRHAITANVTEERSGIMRSEQKVDLHAQMLRHRLGVKQWCDKER